MYIDKMIEFSDSQVFSAETATTETVSDNIADLGAGEKDAFGTTIYADIGNAGTLIWHVLLGEAMVGGSATLTCELITKSVATSMSSGGTIIDTFIIPEAALIGTHYQRPIPMGTISNRYMAVLYRANTDTVDSCLIDSWISMDRNLTDSPVGTLPTS